MTIDIDIERELIEAAEAVVSRWYTLKWKDEPHTAVFINRLRSAVERAATAPPATPDAAAPAWQPIATAPKDGAYIMLSSEADGGWWVGKFQDQFTSGWKPANPWRSMMLNTDYLKGKRIRLLPTHWMPMLAAAGVVEGQAEATGGADEQYAGWCDEGKRCLCGGDTPRVRAGCANWTPKYLPKGHP